MQKDVHLLFEIVVLLEQPSERAPKFRGNIFFPVFDGLSEAYILINRFNGFNIFQGVSKKPPGEAFTT